MNITSFSDCPNLILTVRDKLGKESKYHVNRDVMSRFSTKFKSITQGETYPNEIIISASIQAVHKSLEYIGILNLQKTQGYLSYNVSTEKVFNHFNLEDLWEVFKFANEYEIIDCISEMNLKIKNYKEFKNNMKTVLNIYAESYNMKNASEISTIMKKQIVEYIISGKAKEDSSINGYIRGILNKNNELYKELSFQIFYTLL